VPEGQTRHWGLPRKRGRGDLKLEHVKLHKPSRLGKVTKGGGEGLGGGEEVTGLRPSKLAQKKREKATGKGKVQ